MKRMDFQQLEVDEKMQESRKALIEELKANPDVIDFMEERNVPMKVLEMYPYRFLEWLKQRNRCRGCKGLKSCKQKQQGYRDGLDYDRILKPVKEACFFQLQKMEETKHLENYLVSDLGMTFESVSFASIDLAHEDPTYLLAYKEATTAYKNMTGLYLYGTMGTGKSYLAACCSNDMARSGKSVCYVHMPSFAQRLRANYRYEDYKKEVSQLGYADFVVFDDIGAEDVTEQNRSILLSILDKRMQNKRMTWFTSNEDINSLRNHFLNTSKGSDRLEAERIIERIFVLAKPVQMIGVDRRSLQIEKL